MKVTAVITAGGTGTRFGTVRPKQFTSLAGKMLIEHTLDAFDRHALIDDIVVVLPESEVGYFKSEHLKNPGTKPLSIATGGPTRQASVRLGLLSIRTHPDFVAIHDAARCLITQQEITDTIQKCIDGWQGAICAIPVRDTLKTVDGERITGTASREKLWAMQTPQVFQYAMIRQAYEKAHETHLEATDDAQVAELLNAKVCVVHGKSTNIKITYPEDIGIAESILQARKKEDDEI